MELLKKLCAVHAPSGEEFRLTEFILLHIVKNQKRWKVQPEILFGDGFHDNLILVFGKKPRTAIFAHADSTGFTAGYEKKLHPIGGVSGSNGDVLTGKDAHGEIECVLWAESPDNRYQYAYHRKIELGTSLCYKADFQNDGKYISSPYLDNRMGVRAALKIAETLENGIIVFSTYEEHKGGGAQIAAKFIFDNFLIRRSLILDVTYCSEGIKFGKGAVISLRDSGIPRKRYLDRIRALAEESGARFQYEVEAYGASDGTAIQASPYPINWCFIGIPAEGVHSSNERADISDYEETVKLYRYLMQKL